MIDGNCFKNAVISGAHLISNQKNSVDELNVFPVPDGDTGTNMSMTMMAACDLLKNMQQPTVAQVAEITASAMLRGARGNSGVILSLLFRGMAKGLKNNKNLTAKALSNALQLGVQSAYHAVMKPTEGTILTVARLSADESVKLLEETSDPVVLFEGVLEKAREALVQTPELLPVLKKAGVVDAGGKGLVTIYEGMLQVLQGGEPVAYEALVQTRKLDTPAAEYEGQITFTYCTEYIVNRVGDGKPLALRAFLESIGDCVVVVEDEEIIKVHVHTDNPGDAIQEGLEFGTLTKIKIDNMREQHQNKAREAQAYKKNDTYVSADSEIPYGFVAVGAGEGLDELFHDLGVDRMVSGGQTMNPSTQDLLQAIHSVPAHTVFVLPNNKNIILAAEQAIVLADREVRVLQTKTVPEGIAAMLAFDPEADLDTNCLEMTKAFERVATGFVTFAARDSDFDGKHIRKNEILGMHNKKIVLVEKDVAKVAYRLVKRMIKGDSQFVTIIYGEDVTEEAAQNLYEMVQAKYGDDIEVSLVAGGQPIYYYMISVE